MNISEQDGFIWMDGHLVPWREAKIHVLTHSLHYGMAAFEGIRAYASDQDANIFRLSDHMNRLVQSAHIMRMDIPYDVDELCEAVCNTVAHNGLSDAYIRPLCYFGAEAMTLGSDDLVSHVSIAAWDLGNYLGSDPDTGIRMQTSSFTRSHVNVSMCRCLLYTSPSPRD